MDPSSIGIHAFEDNQSLIDSIYSTTNVKEDKRLIIDMAMLKEMVHKGELSSAKWTPGKDQLADILTKKGVSSLNLQSVVVSGKLPDKYRNICL